MCSTATNVAKIIKVTSIYKPYIIYKEKSASCQYGIDKMQIYIYQRFLFYQCSKYHIFAPETLFSEINHIYGKCNQQPLR